MKVQAAPEIAAVTLPFPVTLVGDNTSRFGSAKYTLERDERGDIRITASNGRSLLVPKALAVVEYAA